MAAPVADRLAALRASSAVDLAALLERVPALRSALAGRGALSAFGWLPAEARPHPRPTLDRLAALVGSRQGIVAILRTLTTPELQLVQLAAAEDGTLSRAALEAEVGPAAARDPALVAAGTALRTLHLAMPLGDRSATPQRADDAPPWHDVEAVLAARPGTGAGTSSRDDAAEPVLALQPGVADAVELPGVPFAAVADRFSASDLEVLLRVLRVRDVPAGHGRRVAAVTAALRDPDVVALLLVDLPEEPARLLRLLAEHGAAAPAELGWRGFDAWRRWPRTPLHDLSERGLLGMDPATGAVFTWLELSVALRGRLFASWPLEPPPALPLPLDEGDLPEVPGVVGVLDALLARWAEDPAPALQGGGIGVRSTRAAAKVLRVEPGAVGLLASLATSLGLLGRLVVGTRGRGAAKQDELAWAPTERADGFVALPPERRWAHLVRAWLDDPYLDESQGLPERTGGEVRSVLGASARGALLDLLRTLPEGTGLEGDDLVALASWRLPRLLPPPAVRGVAAAAAVLGVRPARGPVGLTAAPRLVLAGGPDALAGALPAPVRRFVVQSDLTVVAPPGLAHDLAAALDRVAVVESDAGARTWRLDGGRVEQAVAAGARVEDLEQLLDAHATAPVPAVARELLRDAARRAGRVRAGPASSYLTCDDPLLLARATGVRAAKLRTLAPTVAISPLARGPLVTALRAAGVAAVPEDAGGVVLEATPQRAQPDPRAGSDLPDLDAAATPDALALAERLLAEASP